MSLKPLAEIERLAKAATPGPWEVTGYGSDQTIVQPGFTRKGDGQPKRLKTHDRAVVALGDDGGCGDPECCGYPSYHVEISDADKAYIAVLYPEQVLAMIAMVRVTREALELTRADAHSLIAVLHALTGGAPTSEMRRARIIRDRADTALATLGKLEQGELK